MRRAIAILALAVLAGCGNSGIEGTLGWDGDPDVTAHSLNGTLKNNTSHSVNSNAKSMRLLDADGRKVTARIRVRTDKIPAHGTTSITATWKSGKPVRIDYGTGALPLPSD